MFKGGSKDKPKDKETKGKDSKKDVKDKKVQESDTEDSSSGMFKLGSVDREKWKAWNLKSVFV